MKNIKTKLILLVLLGIFLFPIYTQVKEIQNNENNWNRDLKYSGSWELLPFVIDDSGGGDYTWAEVATKEWCSGLGTSVNPYIIKNIIIDGLSSLNCITIRYSSAYFIIRDSTFYNGRIGIDLAGVYNGILINNTIYSNLDHGIALGGYDTLITNNIIYSNGDEGIYLIGSRNTISNNIINDNNLNGIKLEGTGEYNTISNNIINDNRNDEGIFLFGGSNNLIIGNDINRNGIRLSEGWGYGCYNNELTGNIINNGGVSIYGDTVVEVASHYIDTTNLVNGKPLYYYTNEIGLNPSDFENAGQVILVNVRDSLILNLNVSYTSYPSGKGFSCGFSLYYSTNNTISNNIVSFGNEGIELIYSNGNTIENNTISNNNRDGMYTRYCSNNIISRNVVSNNFLYGIWLWGDNNIVSENILNNNQQHYGIRLYEGDNNIISKNIANNNGGDGMQSRGNNNTITGNIANNNYDDGISLDRGSNNTISNNTICKNRRFGTFLYNSENTLVYNNIFIENNINGRDSGTNNQWDNGTIGNYWDDYIGSDADDDGIGDSPYSDYGVLDNYPIWWDSPVISIISPISNSIFGINAPDFEILIDEGISVTMWYTLDEGLINITFIETTGTIEQFAWSILPDGLITIKFYANDTKDYEGYNSVIVIRDTVPPMWDENPTDQPLEFGSSFNYDLDASDPSGIDDWWLNDTTYFDIDGNGVITNKVLVPIGEYWLEVNVNDILGNIITDTFKVTVQDTTPPSWVQIPSDKTMEFGGSFNYDVNAIDISGIDHYWINDTTYFQIDGNGIIINIISLNVGTYWLEVRAYDPYRHYCIAIFKVIVQEPEPEPEPATPEIAGYPILLIGLAIGIISISLIIKLRKRNE